MAISIRQEKSQFFSVVDRIVKRGLGLINKYMPGENFPIDYVAIFSKDKKEEEKLLKIASQLGKVIEKTKTGLTFKLEKPRLTKAGF